MTEVYIPMNIDVERTYKGFEGKVRYNYLVGVGVTTLEYWVDAAPLWDTVVTVVE